jgi:hypothetical protein
MREDIISTANLVTQTKKAYIKPIVSKVRLVAEEAVLALCKYNDAGARGACVPPDLSCVSTRRS